MSPQKKKATTKKARTPRRRPETLRLRNVEPGLTVNDLLRSLAWYRDVLGFTEGERWEHDGRLAGVSVTAGTVTINLTQDDWAKGRDRKKGEGFRLYLNTVQDVDEIAGLIKSRGGMLDSEPRDMPWGARVFQLADPDGFKLTISSIA
jgi:lactoylglutathione lyase